MSDQEKDIFATVFSDKQVQQLILVYMHSQSYNAAGEFNPASFASADVIPFLNACKRAVVEAEAIRMAADGLLLIEWDKETGRFAFALSDIASRASTSRSIWSRVRRLWRRPAA